MQELSGENEAWQAAQASHWDVCAWQTLFRSLLPGSEPQHIPLSLPPATEGLVLLAARDQDLHCGIQDSLL